MSWSGGTYRKGNYGTNGWTGDASLGIGIEAGRHDTQDDDFATGINQCLNKDGSNSATGNLNIGANRVTNLGTGTARNDAATVAQVQDNTSSYLGTTGGTSTAFTVTATPTITALTTGAQYVFKANAANGAAATLKIDGTAATTMQRQGTALAGNEFKANDMVSVVYDGTNFQITNIAEAPLFVDRTNNRVGIGTTAPASDLHIQASPSASTTKEYIRITNNTAADTITSRIAFNNYNGIASSIDSIQNAATNFQSQLVFSTQTGSGMTEKMRIQAGGNVGIGTNNPTSSLQVAGIIDITPDSEGVHLGMTAAGAFAGVELCAATGGYIDFTTPGIDTKGRIIFDATTNKMTLSATSGFIVSGMTTGAGTNAVKISTATGALTYDTSSIRYKDNVRDSHYGLSSVLTMQSRQFEYKDTGRTDIGFIAEELVDVIPELVMLNQNNEPDAVSYDRITSVLCKAIQELNAKVEALEARVAALEA